MDPGTAGSHGGPVLSFGRALHIGFCNGCTHFHSRTVCRSCPAKASLCCCGCLFAFQMTEIETHWSFKKLIMSLKILILVLCVHVSLCVVVCPCQCAGMHMQRSGHDIMSSSMAAGSRWSGNSLCQFRIVGWTALGIHLSPLSGLCLQACISMPFL